MSTQRSLISAALAADIPILLWGPPGTGKTAQIQALARQAGAHLEVLIGSTLDPVDVGGQPVPDVTGTLRISPPPWARRIRAAIDADRPAWLFLDELSCALPAVQAALLRVIHDRAVADLSIAGCRVVAAANPPETAADGGTIAAATANRLAHVEWSIDPAAWVAGEASGWGTPRAAAHLAASAHIAAYISAHPAALLAVPADVTAAGRAWPSPRSWSAAARLLAADPDASPADRRALVATVVGAAAAAEWAEYAAAADLPDPEAMLAGIVRLPTRGDRIRAALIAVASAALTAHPQRQQRIKAAWGIVASVRPDVGLAAAQVLRAGAPEEIPDEVVALGDRILDARAAIGAARAP